jgi:hypothetical protein
VLQSEELVYEQAHKGTILPLEGKSYGSFNGGKVIVDSNNDPILYISPE